MPIFLPNKPRPIKVLSLSVLLNAINAKLHDKRICALIIKKIHLICTFFWRKKYSLFFNGRQKLVLFWITLLIKEIFISEHISRNYFT